MLCGASKHGLCAASARVLPAVLKVLCLKDSFCWPLEAVRLSSGSSADIELQEAGGCSCLS